MNPTKLLVLALALGTARPVAAALPPGAGGVPTLTDTVQLTQDGRQEEDPAISFADGSSVGLITWGKRVGLGSVGSYHQDAYASTWDGADWGAEAFVPGQKATARHRTYSIDFAPADATALVTFVTSNTSVTTDDVRARTWDPVGGWNAGPIVVGDQADDDDWNGTVRFASDGSYGLSVWQDTPYPNNKSRVVANVWDPATATFGAKSVLTTWGADLKHDNQLHDESLAQDPVSGQWIVAYQESSACCYSESGRVGYLVGSVDELVPTFGEPVALSDPASASTRPCVSFSPAGDGALFWSQRDPGGEQELMAARWNGVGFDAPIQLTSGGGDRLFQTAEPIGGGWQVFYTSTPGCGADTELYTGFFDGLALGDETRLTADGEDQVEVAAALDPTGRLQLVWLARTPEDLLDTELFVATLDFDGPGLSDADAALEVTRLGTPPNPDVFLPGQTSGPLIGATWDPVVDHTAFAPNATTDFVLISTVALELDLGQPGTLLCSLTPPWTVELSGPGVPFDLLVPDVCALVGAELCTQAGSIESNGAWHLTNALDLTIGTH